MKEVFNKEGGFKTINLNSKMVFKNLCYSKTVLSSN